MESMNHASYDLATSSSRLGNSSNDEGFATTNTTIGIMQSSNSEMMMMTEPSFGTMDAPFAATTAATATAAAAAPSVVPDMNNNYNYKKNHINNHLHNKMNNNTAPPPPLTTTTTPFLGGGGAGVVVDPNTSTSTTTQQLQQLQILVQEAIDGILYIEKTGYLRVSKEAPHLINVESNPMQFLQFENYNVWAAAYRIVHYWEWKSVFFGGNDDDHDRVLRPIFDVVSGQGALSPYDLELYHTGAFVLLPTLDQYGNSVVVRNRSMLRSPNDDASDIRILRIVFYIWSLACCAQQQQQQKQQQQQQNGSSSSGSSSGGIVLLYILSSLPNRFEQRGKNLTDFMKQAMPIRLVNMHLFLDPNISSFIPANVLLPTVIQFFQTWFTSSKVIPHVMMNQNDVGLLSQELEQNYGLTKEGLPECLGGLWKYEDFFASLKQQQQQQQQQQQPQQPPQHIHNNHNHNNNRNNHLMAETTFLLQQTPPPPPLMNTTIHPLNLSNKNFIATTTTTTTTTMAKLQNPISQSNNNNNINNNSNTQNNRIQTNNNNHNSPTLFFNGGLLPALFEDNSNNTTIDTCYNNNNNNNNSNNNNSPNGIFNGDDGGRVRNALSSLENDSNNHNNNNPATTTITNSRIRIPSPPNPLSVTVAQHFFSSSSVTSHYEDKQQQPQQQQQHKGDSSNATSTSSSISSSSGTHFQLLIQTLDHQSVGILPPDEQNWLLQVLRHHYHYSDNNNNNPNNNNNNNNNNNHFLATESDLFDFHRHANFDIVQTIRQFAKYWQVRRHLFGKHRALLPMNQTGEGALNEEDIQTIHSGFLMILPADSQGNAVLSYDLSRAKNCSFESQRRCFFYFLFLLSLRSYMGRTMKMLVFMDNIDLEAIISDNLSFSDILEAFPTQLCSIHTFLGPVDFGWLAYQDRAQYKLTKLLLSSSSSSNNNNNNNNNKTPVVVDMNFHTMGPHRDLLFVLLQYDFNTEHLPSSVGGEWNEACFQRWQTEIVNFESKNKNKEMDGIPNRTEYHQLRTES